MKLIPRCRNTKKYFRVRAAVAVRQKNEAQLKIIVRSDGPLRIEGECELVDVEGRPYGLAGRTAFALCRCGHSANKPFCDGAHKAAGFQDKQEARDLPPPAPPK
jgi:CDGSH-type Zn-finger protein